MPSFPILEQPRDFILGAWLQDFQPPGKKKKNILVYLQKVMTGPCLLFCETPYRLPSIRNSKNTEGTPHPYAVVGVLHNWGSLFPKFTSKAKVVLWIKPWSRHDCVLVGKNNMIWCKVSSLDLSCFFFFYLNGCLPKHSRLSWAWRYMPVMAALEKPQGRRMKSLRPACAAERDCLKIIFNGEKHFLKN